MLNKLSRIALDLARRWEPADIQQQSVVSSTRYDMMAAPNELYYAEQYWTIMRPHFNTLPRDAQVLDLGCGQGRFTNRLGKFFAHGQVVGCDISAKAIDQAKHYTASDSVGNIDFIVQPIEVCLEDFDVESVDVILLIEVTFICPQWKQHLPRMIQILKPGGILVISFRSQYFNALCLVRERILENAETVLRDREGRIFGSQTIFTWQTGSEIRDLLTETHGLDLIELRGIGACSGIPGDPHDQICQTSKLNETEKQQLMKLELELGKTVPDGGRYILAMARKPQDETIHQ
jgi:2-polyprenyl-3-methyl-5-hydroxy-6-metoxy-1,4-benzoquinol methylase